MMKKYFEGETKAIIESKYNFNEKDITIKK